MKLTRMAVAATFALGVLVPTTGAALQPAVTLDAAASAMTQGPVGSAPAVPAVVTGGMSTTTSGQVTRTASDLSSCASIDYAGDAGDIHVQTSPSGFVQWNVVDYTDNGGKWVADVYVDQRRVDHKDQDYNPHGSVNPVDAKSGSTFQLDITHVNTRGETSHSVPNGCIIP